MPEPGDATAPLERVRSAISALAAALRAAFPLRRWVALRAAIAVALPLLIGVAVGEPVLGAQASFGSLAVLYVSDSPYRYRARVVGGVGAALTVGVFLGALAGSLGWVAVAVTVAVLTGAASFVCQATELPPPREVILVMVTLAASAIPGDPARVAALTAGGAAIAWLVSMSPAPAGWRGPETRALAAALGAVAGYLEAIAGPGETPARHRAVDAVRRAVRAVEQGATRSGGRLERTAMATQRLLEAALHIGVVGAPADPRWAGTVRAVAVAVLADGPPPQPVADPDPPADRTMPDALNGLIDAVGSADTTPGPWPSTVPDLRTRLRAAAWRGSVIGPGAARIGVTVGVGVALGSALGVAHAYWIGLTACAVLQGSNLTVTRRRFLHRVLGTLAGVVLASAILYPQPSVLVMIAVVTLAQLAVELTITVNYGLAVAGITVLALLLVHLADPTAAVGGLVVARLLDTLLGAALALVMRLVLWPRATLTRLPPAQSRTLRTVADLLRERWRQTDDRTRQGRLGHRLQSDLLDLRAVQTDALADSLRAPATDDLRWSVTAMIDDFAVLTLAIPPDRRPPPVAEAEPVLAAINELADAVIAGRSARLPYLPVLTTYPRLTARLTTLAVAVADVGDR